MVHSWGSGGQVGEANDAGRISFRFHQLEVNFYAIFE